jgi:hypothetical protein
MKAYGGVDIRTDPRLLDLCTSLRWVVSFMPRPLYPRYPLDRRLGGPQSRSRRHGVVKILAPIGTRTPTPWSSSAQQVAIPIELPRLLIKTVVLHIACSGAKLGPPTQREDNNLRVIQNRKLRRICGSKRKEVKGAWRKLRNEELHNFYSTIIKLWLNQGEWDGWDRYHECMSGIRKGLYNVAYLVKASTVVLEK